MEIKDKQNTYSSNSTVTESIELKIGNYGKIMNIMRSSMYSNPIRTLVQEYISNANDIHIEQGQKRPIEITMPTVSNPVFSVRDFGTGLTKEQMINVYSQYGVSTKDKANDQMGGFGLGCKSFWAYNSVFFVKSYINGEVYTYMAHLGKSDAGHFDLQSVEKTNEPNGLEVFGNVKDKDFNGFKNAIIRCCAFMTIKPIINGFHKDEIPECLKSITPFVSLPEVKVYSKEQLSDISQNYGSDVLVVIDNVIYELSTTQKQSTEYQQLSKILSTNAVVILPAKVGQLEVSSSREALFDDADGKTKKGLQLLLSNAYTSIIKDCNKKIAGLKTLKDFVANTQQFKELFSITDKLVFRKDKYAFSATTSGNIESHLFEQLNLEEVYLKQSYGRRRGNKTIMKTNEVTSFNPNCFLVFQKEAIHKNKNRIQKILDESDYEKVVVVKYSGNDEAFDWLVKELNIPNLADFEAYPQERMPNFNPSKAKNKEQFCLHEILSFSDSYGRKSINKKITHHRMDTFEDKLIYFVMEKNALPDNFSEREDLQDLIAFSKEKGITFAGVNSSIASKLAKMDDTILLEDFLKNPLDFEESSLNEDNAMLNTLIVSDLKRISLALKDTKIENKELAKAINEYANLAEKVDATSPQYCFYTPCVKNKMSKEMKKLDKRNTQLEKTLSEYPLVKTILMTAQMENSLIEEMVFYINAKK